MPSNSDILFRHEAASRAARIRQRLRGAAPWLAAAAVLLPLWGFVAWFAAVYPRGLLEAQQRELAASSRAAAALGAAVLQRAQASLRKLDFWLAADSRTDAAALARLGELARDPHLRLLDLALVDRRDQILPLTADIAGTLGAGNPPADEPLLTLLRQTRADTGLRFGEPLRLAGDTARARLPLLLPLSAARGEVVAAVALLDLDRLAAQLAPLADGTPHAVLLIGRDGLILARSPAVPGPLARNAFDSEGEGLHRADLGRASGAFVAVAAGEGSRHVAYQTLAGFEVQALVLAGQAEALRVYQYERSILLALALLFSAAVLAAATLFARSAQRARWREAEERAAVDASPVGLFRCAPDGRLIDANDTFLRLLGLHCAADALPWGWLSLLPLPERELARTRWAAQMARREPALLVRALRRPDGRTRLLALRTAPLLREDGRLLGQAGTLEDITEREAHEQTRRSLLAAFDRLPEPALQLDPAGHIVYANPAARRFLALPAEGSCQGLSYTQLCTPERAARYRHEMLPAALRDGAWHGREALPDPGTGRARSVLTQVIAHRGRQGKLARVTVLLREAPGSATPVPASAAAPVMIAVLDGQLRCLFLHEALARHYGLHRKHWLSRPVAELLSEADYNACRSALQGALAGHSGQTLRRYETRKGPQQVELHYAPLLTGEAPQDDDGRAAKGVIISVREIGAAQAGTEQGAQPAQTFEQQVATLLRPADGPADGRADGQAYTHADADAPRPRSVQCVLAIAVQGLGEVRAQHGPEVAAAALQAVSRRLRHVLRPRDLLAPAGDGGFHVFVSGLRCEADVEGVAAKLGATLESPVRIGQSLMRLGARVVPRIVRPGETEAAALIDAADARLRRASECRT